jgi:zinc transport system substrate-binding protein
MRIARRAFLVGLAVAAGGVATTPAAAAAGADPVIFVGIPPLEFAVERLAGDFVTVEVLLPPGASPHTYEPTPRQMAALDRATLYLQIGVPFEGPFLDKVSSVVDGLSIVDCRNGVELVPIEGDDQHDHGHGFLDPHIWLDPARMQLVAANIAEALTTILPDRSSEIERNLRALDLAIIETDRRVATVLEPLSGRTMVVFHPAYGYFARRYGLNQLAVEVEGKSPTARQLAAIVDSLRDRSVHAIFVQPQYSTTAAQRVADAVGCSLVELDPIAGNYLANLELMAGRIAASLGD